MNGQMKNEPTPVKNVNREANEYARTFDRIARMHGIDLPMGLIAELIGLFEVALSPEVVDAAPR